MCADVAVHTLGPERFPEFSAVVNAAFGFHADPRTDEVLSGLSEPDRRLGATTGERGERLVGTAAAFSFTMTVPGGGTVPVGAVTAVSVSPTHRRRGILRRMMAAQLDDIASRGELLAVLTASDSGIYPRFGYGMATFSQALDLDTARVAFREPVGDGLDLQLLRGDEALPAVPAIYERWRPGRPGAFTYTPRWWLATLGAQETYIGGGRCFVVLCEPGASHGGGYAIYTTSHTEADERMRLDVRMLVAGDPVVEARLWRYLVEVDLVRRVRAELVPVDTPLRWWVTDPREVRAVEQRDWLHVRILDVPAALAARRYAADGELVVDVTDPFRPDPTTQGRFALSVRDGAGECGTTARSPDLELGVAALGSLYLGGVRATQLAAAGLVRERVPGAAARADALFGWPVAPFCPTHF
jgi:predicted acetyltransferase